MKTALFPIMLGLAGAVTAEDSFKVELVQYKVGSSLGDEVPFEVKPMGHKFGAELSFLVKGEGLVAFKDDSVVIKSMIDRDGKELSKNTRGKAVWKEGSFPKVSEDGDLASFSVELRGDLMGKLEGATIDGSVVMSTGGETDKGSGKLSKGAKPVEIGPFKVSIGKAGMFGRDGTSIKIQGDYAAIIELEVKDGDKKLDDSGTSWSGDTKTYSFEKAEAKELDVTISYWKNLSEVTVPIKVTIGSK